MGSIDVVRAGLAGDGRWEGRVFRRWQEVSLAPTRRSCLPVVDTWFPKAEAPAGISLLASIVADKLEAFLVDG